eukprot:9326568-Karenia_brevis.AAC.1
MVETKQAGEAGANKVRAAARKYGWKASVTEAHRTACDRASGGTAIFVKGAYGITQHADVND